VLKYQSTRNYLTALLLALVAATAMTPLAGCVGVARHLIWVTRGKPVAPDFDGLQGKRVAIVCISDGSDFGPQSIANKIARNVSLQLDKNGKRIDVIDVDKVEEWMDHNDWEVADYRTIGKDLKAEMVVGIDLSRFSLHRGSTLYQGQADATITVYDMEDEGKVVYEKEFFDYTFPKEGGIPSVGMPEKRFRSEFLLRFSESISQTFHPFQFYDNWATDGDQDGL